MSNRHANISVFVPHIGCPNRCSFCDQRTITGSQTAPGAQDVVQSVNAAVAHGHCPQTTEIAFFGGSFTAINRNYMLHLLQTAERYVQAGIVGGIRISTRPDAIDDEILTLLKQHRVTAIELGAQSMDDRVLRMNNRGHTANDVRTASAMIRQYGFSLGLQMMTGLYGDSDAAALETAREIIEMNPDTVRIYPTIVLKNTDLAALYADRIYQPQSLDAAVTLAAKLLIMFHEADIPVIRLGLHSIEADAYVAGPWHPAFSELCRSAVYLQKAREQLSGKGSYRLYVKPGAVSQMVGQRRSNLMRLRALGFDCRVFPHPELGEFQVKTERVGDVACC